MANSDLLKQQIISLANKELKHVKNDMSLNINDKFLELPIIVNDRDIVEGVLCYRYGHNGHLISPSPQIGCCVGCKFCDMSDLSYGGNLSAEIMLEQIALVLNRALRYGYQVTEKPLKISFVKGGETLLNPEFPKLLDLIAKNLTVPIKISTTFPDVPMAHQVYQAVEKFAIKYPETFQIQISLISTNQQFRQQLTKMPLISFEQLRQYAESWQKNVPQPRKITLTFTLTENTPCDPQEIINILSPQYFAIRIRDYMPTTPGLKAGLSDSSESRVQDVTRQFEQAGYQMIPGRIGVTERRFKLSAGHIIKIYKSFLNRN
jgi:adenine C2-methylase RlmN of 23S rRNA A2503 and tRNA A37